MTKKYSSMDKYSSADNNSEMNSDFKNDLDNIKETEIGLHVNMDEMTDREMFDGLMKKMQRYHPSADLTSVERAYIMAKEAHGNQLRKSGEPYIIHPVSVAYILTDLEMDKETIIAGLLHDVIEDTVCDRNDISRLFTEEVALLVDGVTKLEKMEYKSLEEQQADNYRKMFLAMAEDIRVVIIKIADRLHNLRTLQFMTPEKQKKIAQETLDIYAPLCHRLGISKIRYELEDLSFRYSEPEAYYNLKEKINRKQTEREEFVQKIVAELKEKLTEADIKAVVDGRPKHFFSIYKKMISQEKTLDQIYDLFAVRVIVDNLRDCYGVLCVVHTMYHPIQGRFKDYIAMPKSNKYQSLHDTLIGPAGEPFEIQIRTFDMHRYSEYGIAAHWKYKSGGSGNRSDASKEEEKLAWLRQILEWQREYTDNKDYLDALKFDLNVYKDNIYCFSPKGEVINLLSGSTPIDFAYAIHSAVGNKMIGSKVNGRMVTIDHVLETGDRVEVLTSQNSKGPSRDWLKVVKTSQARSKINQWFKKEDKEDNIQKGKEILLHAAKKKGITLGELASVERIALVLNRYSMKDWDTVCAAIGHGAIKEGQVINRMYDDYLLKNPKELTPDDIIKNLLHPNAAAEHEQKKKYSSKSGIIVGDGIDIDVRFSKCCSPVPGDEIVGFITRGRGASIHRTDCINIINLEELDKHRLIETFWQLPNHSEQNISFRADIQMIGMDRTSLLSEVSEILNKENISVKSLNARTQKETAIFLISIVISSKEQLDKVMQKLNNIQNIYSVDRVTT